MANLEPTIDIVRMSSLERSIHSTLCNYQSRSYIDANTEGYGKQEVSNALSNLVASGNITKRRGVTGFRVKYRRAL